MPQIRIGGLTIQSKRTVEQIVSALRHNLYEGATGYTEVLSVDDATAVQMGLEKKLLGYPDIVLHVAAACRSGHPYYSWVDHKARITIGLYHRVGNIQDARRWTIGEAIVGPYTAVADETRHTAEDRRSYDLAAVGEAARAAFSAAENAS